MIIEGQKVKVKWSNRNKTYYTNLNYKGFKNGETFLVSLEHLPLNSPSTVEIICDYCGKHHFNEYRRKSHAKNHFCSRECQDNFLIGKPPWNKKSIFVNCAYCHKEIERSEWELKYHKNLFCGKECTDNYLREFGEGRPKVERFKINCDQCGEEIERTQVEIDRSEKHFCNKKCADEFMKGKEQLDRRNGYDVDCYNCGTKFYFPKYRIESQERYFCSEDCRREWLKSDEFSMIMSQVEKPKTDKLLVNCSVCRDTIEKYPSEMRGKLHFCSSECKGIYFSKNNPNPKKEKVKVNCEYCNKELDVHESKAKINKWHFCSRECYSKYRSEFITGEDVYNYQGIIKDCDNCGKETKVTEYYLENRKNVFCSQDCYYEYRSKFYIGENHPQFGSIKTPEQIEKMRIITASRIANGDFPQTNTSIQIITRRLLAELNYDFGEEKQFKYYVLDFYGESYNLAIEVMGDYWHANPIKYTDYNTLHDIQKKDIKRDKSKKTYLNRYYDINILYLWENDINKNELLCKKLIQEYINNNGILKDYNSFNYELIDDTLQLKNNITQPFFMRANTINQVI
jgi:endogenous inhibitor of DNA gyrase (YacG/DUF329 family)